MTRKVKNKPDYSLIYPGTIKTPAFLKRSHTHLSADVQKIKSAVTINEHADEIAVHINMPGFKREEFFIIVKNCRVLIYALHRQTETDDTIDLSVRSAYCFRRYISLPKNVDTDFVSAEYKNGELCMRFLKTFLPCDSKKHQVAVY